MPPYKSVCAPTSAPIPDTLRVPSSTPGLTKSLNRLSKQSLIDLVLEWLEEDNQTSCAPYLVGNRNVEEQLDEDYLWSPSENLEELRLTYNRMRTQYLVGRRSVVDRILDGDWRRGLSLHQLATIDLRFLAQKDDALRWTALKLLPQDDGDEDGGEPLKKKRRTNPAPYPAISPTTFLRNLEREISPLVKAHYSLHKLSSYRNLPVIRICATESPYANSNPARPCPAIFTDPTRVIFIALPDSCPYIYVSVSGATTDSAGKKRQASSVNTGTLALKRIVLEDIPKAFSKSHHRYSLKSTSLTAHSLSALSALRGNSGTNAANGIYTIFGSGIVDSGPIGSDQLTFAQKIIGVCQERVDSKVDGAHTNTSRNTQEEGRGHPILSGKNIKLPVAQSLNTIESGLNLEIRAALRFGTTGIQHPIQRREYGGRQATHACLDRLQIRLDQDIQFPTRTGHIPRIAYESDQGICDSDGQEPLDSAPQNKVAQSPGRLVLAFHGSDIFLGLRNLFESGAISPDKLPSWMTGEEAISGGTVTGGAVVQGKGSGA